MFNFFRKRETPSLPPAVADQLSDAFQPTHVDAEQPWWQFSIGEMLVITAYIALGIALTKAFGVVAAILFFNPYVIVLYVAFYRQYRKQPKIDGAVPANFDPSESDSNSSDGAAAKNV
jgi:hypothetical protein